MKRAVPYKTESEMCSQFISEIGDAWTAYGETCGWDILLVRKSDGYQIGVEAKLKLNSKVIVQALESHYSNQTGPDCRAVLVPDGEDNNELKMIADYIGITVIRIWPMREYQKRGFDPVLPEENRGHHWWNEKWHEQCPTDRHKLPDYVPDVAAGASAPVQLTDWKIRAMKAAILVEKIGFITRTDFKHLRLDHRRWIAREYGWLRKNEQGEGWIAGVHFPNYRLQHPRVYGEIEADYEKWKPTEPNSQKETTT